MKKVKIGFIGCGNISGIYLKNSQWLEILEPVACADLILERAEARAKEFNIPTAGTVAELLANPEIEIVVNLTVPQAHAEVALAALKAGKHVYGEKPLAVNRADGRKIIEVAKKKGLRVGSAPDTFLGAGIQTCRKLIDDGWIGRPVAAMAFFTCHGHESWHPSPEFYYQIGGGPMLDMGPYYLTAMINLLGPIKRVTGIAGKSFARRLITSQPKYGTVVDVETPTHVAGTLEFANGAIGTIVTSFDVWAANLPRIEIHGTEGSLSVPDPNGFGGPVKIFRPGQSAWVEAPLSHIYAENGRGLGVADMAYAIRSKRPQRASGELAFHVLDVMLAFLDASDAEKQIAIASTCKQPAPLPLGLRHGALDE